jgi:hypothetical protein
MAPGGGVKERGEENDTGAISYMYAHCSTVVFMAPGGGVKERGRRMTLEPYLTCMHMTPLWSLWLQGEESRKGGGE